MKLISMVDFVENQMSDETWGKTIKEKYTDQIEGYVLGRIWEYSKFLKQILKIWMFVPCDKDNKLMRHPDELKGTYSNSKAAAKYRTRYNKALDRVLFKGFERGIFNSDDSIVSVNFGRHTTLWTEGFAHQTVEKLVSYGFELTKSAKEQIEIK